MEVYGHSHPEFPDQPDKWEPLFSEDCGTLNGKICSACENLAPNHGHINKVAYLAGRFAADMFPTGTSESLLGCQWGQAAGFWHDLGKYSQDFQELLRGKRSKVNHSDAGARWACRFEPYGPIMAYLIAGHHAGLSDGEDLFYERLRGSDPPEWESAASASGVLDYFQKLDFPLTRAAAGLFGCGFTSRMLFSCLVDADFLATESFMQPDEVKKRPSWPENILERMSSELERHIQKRFGSPVNRVDQWRARVRADCREKADLTPGYFSLTVPTGGGKTLSSLEFSLRHACIHGHRRVIYAIPYTSIIEQNASVFRDVFGDLKQSLDWDPVLEHHSDFEEHTNAPDDHKPVWRMIAENWDAPLVATTNVQFFESLFASRSSRCRKLHRIARSVIILDEAQAIPSRLLAPVLKALECLVEDFGCSVVFCTATQPALGRMPDFPIGIHADRIREIVTDPVGLHKDLKRVQIKNLGGLSNSDLVDRVVSNAGNGLLLVVNTTKAARELHTSISGQLPVFHLSARMCPAHRSQVLRDVMRMRKENQPCVLVSTQLIEAGVDISFPVVYRAESGSDSLAQSAGRCNRNGEWGVGPDAGGQVYVFEALDYPLSKIPALKDLQTAADIAKSHIWENYQDLLSLDAIEAYFRHAFWLQGGHAGRGWDQAGVLDCFQGNQLKAMKFSQASELFQMIPQRTHSLIIPWNNDAKDLIERLKERERSGLPPRLHDLRRAQAFTVRLYDNEWSEILNKSESLFGGDIQVLANIEQDYDSQTGLKPGNTRGFIGVC